MVFFAILVRFAPGHSFLKGSCRYSTEELQLFHEVTFITTINMHANQKHPWLGIGCCTVSTCQMEMGKNTAGHNVQGILNNQLHFKDQKESTVNLRMYEVPITFNLNTNTNPNLNELQEVTS